MTPPPDLSRLSSSEKDTLIAALLARIDALVARVEALEAENAVLREKLNLPPKTPDNSSKPPSQGHKAERREPGEAEGQGPCGGASAAAPQPDAAARRAGRSLPALPGRCRRRRAGRGSGLRPHRNPRDHAGRDAGDAASAAPAPVAPSGSRRPRLPGWSRGRRSARICAPSCCTCASARRSRSSAWNG